jgi:hypothetical protein
MRTAAPTGWSARIAHGVGALLVGDIIVGMTAFSMITLGGLWIFCVEWIRIAGEYGAVGRMFFSPWQLDMAWGGALACLPMAVAVLLLGGRSLQIPIRLYRAARQGRPSV